MLDRLKDLEDHNKLQTEQGLTTAVRLSGETFSKHEDVETWLIKHGPASAGSGVPSYGLFICPLILYHWAFCRMAGVKELDSVLASLKKLNLVERDLRALESFCTDLPFLLSGKKDGTLATPSNSVKSQLDNLKSYNDWELPGFQTGFRQLIEQHLQRIVNSLHSMIERTYIKHPFVIAMAKEMLSISHTFIQKLHAYISETFTNFKAMNIGSDKEIWHLVTFVVEQLFVTNFAKRCEEAIGTLDPNSRVSGFISIWCSMCSVDLVHTLVTTGIKDTPCVSTSYVRYVMSQSNMGKIGPLIEENKALKRSLEVTNLELSAVKRIATEAKRIADSAVSRINAQNGGSRNGGGRCNNNNNNHNQQNHNDGGDGN